MHLRQQMLQQQASMAGKPVESANIKKPLHGLKAAAPCADAIPPAGAAAAGQDNRHAGSCQRQGAKHGQQGRQEACSNGHVLSRARAWP